MDYMEVEAESFQRQALEIQLPGEDFDPSAEPQTGEEYLTRMLYERQRCPAIVVRRPKNLDVKSTLPVSTAAAAVAEQQHTPSPTLLPTVEWKAVQADIFLGKRKRIMEMRATLAAHGYDNTLEPPFNTEDPWSTVMQFCQQHPPLLRTILRINQRNLETLLDLLSKWLSGNGNLIDDEGDGDDDDKADLKSNAESEDVTGHKIPLLYTSSSSSAAAAATESFTCNALDLSSSEQWLGSWLYAVLACLHLPLEPHVHSTLREIARACIRQRGNLQPQELGKAVPYNLFIHLIAKVFGQLDFAEFV